ncbi:MAG TPA: hypothetical protein VHJ20_05365 [Polyangia bacterium]|nr:hypothetical protein [Polyangia bacterium]
MVRPLDPDRNVPIASRAPTRIVREPDVLARVTLAFFTVAVAAWIVLSWTGYRGDYVGAQQAWHRGAHNLVEITLVREDETKLACASGVSLGALACAFDGDRHPRAVAPPDPDLLRPYSTTGGDVIVGAGLWSAATLRRPLPAERFTVVCDFEVVDLVRSLSLRWAPDAAFDAATKSLPVGRLTGCTVPP